MSLILEALKRAERERKRKQTPDFSSVLQEDNSGRHRFRPLLTLLCIVLIVIVILLIVVFWQKEPTQPIAQEPTRAPVPIAEKKAEKKTQKPSPRPVNPLAMLAERASGARAKRSRTEEDPFQALAKAMGKAKAQPAEESSDADAIESDEESSVFGPIESDEESSVFGPVESDKESSVFGGAKSTRHMRHKATTAGTQLPDDDGDETSINKRPVEMARLPEDVAEAHEDDDSGSVQPQEPEPIDTSEETADQVVSSESIPTIYELPLEIQQRLETLSLNVHAYYDDPNRRFVYINMKRYQEGDRIEDDTTGPLLVEIFPEGVIIDYGGRKAKLLTTR